jgi:hypothetical protein
MKTYILAILLCLGGFTITNKANAISKTYPVSTAAAIENWKNLKLSEFIMLSPKDYSKVTGKKMNLGERISFSIMKVRMKHALKKNPNMTVSEYMASGKMGTAGWILIGVAGGILIIILLAVIITPNISISM